MGEREGRGEGERGEGEERGKREGKGDRWAYLDIYLL